jgi:hypothetical protein
VIARSVSGWQGRCRLRVFGRHRANRLTAVVHQASRSYHRDNRLLQSTYPPPRSGCNAVYVCWREISKRRSRKAWGPNQEPSVIARFRFLLPFRIHIPIGAELSPYSVKYGGYEFVVPPPYKASLSPETYSALCDPDGLGPLTVPVNQIRAGLSPANPPMPDPNVEISGASVIAANAVEVRAQRPDFDRRSIQSGGNTERDPSFSLATDVVNDCLRRFRAISRSSKARQLSLRRAFKILEYLDDNGQPLPSSDPPLIRWVADVHAHGETAVLTVGVWNAVTSQKLPYSPPVWETLLLDAAASVTEVGASLVLAVTALETAIDSALEAKSQACGIPSDLWSWFMKRRFRLDQKCGDLLQLVSGESLTADSERARALKNITAARNSFAHGGVAFLNESPVTEEQAVKMISETRGLIEWIVGVCSLAAAPPSESVEIKLKGTLVEAPADAQPE